LSNLLERAVMNMTHTNKKIIWAIDPFEETIKSRAQLITALKHISNEQEAVVEPVHVLKLSLENEEDSEIAQSQLSEYKYGAERATQEVLKDIRGLQFLPPRILMVEDSSPAGMTKALVDYATATHSLLIVVGTHARHGLPRLFLGSFAETLLLHSQQMPVITVGPECLSRTQQNQILFATDFKEGSAQAYQRVLNFAKNLKAEITLFHVIPHGIEPILQSGMYLLSGGWVSPPDYPSEKEDLRRKKWCVEILPHWQHLSTGGPALSLPGLGIEV